MKMCQLEQYGPKREKIVVERKRGWGGFERRNIKTKKRGKKKKIKPFLIYLLLTSKELQTQKQTKGKKKLKRKNDERVPKKK